MKHALAGIAVIAALASAPVQAKDGQITAAVIGGIIGYSIANSQSSPYPAMPVYRESPVYAPAPSLPPVVINFPTDQGRHRHHGYHGYHGHRGACDPVRVPVYRHGRIVEYIQHCSR
jgi:hypothetical protein